MATAVRPVTDASEVVGGHRVVAWFADVDRFARATPWLHEPAALFATYGVVVFAGLLLLAWWSARHAADPRRVALALWAPVGALVALGVNQLLVHAIAEPRPYAVLPHALVLVHRSADASFPSDHAVMAGAVAAGVLLAGGRAGARGALAVATVVLALLMAADRVYVGAHFPGDVVAGLVVGATVATASALALRPLLQWLTERVAATRLRPLLLAGPAATA